MASSLCNECSKRVLTHWDTYPYCSDACRREEERRRERSTSSRPGRARGY